MEHSLKSLRIRLLEINQNLLKLLNQRAEIVLEVQKKKQEQDIPVFVPEREQHMLNQLVQENQGPFPDETIKKLFKEIFKASVALMQTGEENTLRVSRKGRQNRVITVGSYKIGESPIIIAGPCSVESQQQLETVAGMLVNKKIGFLRGGAFKPRSSPYSFQGLGTEGLKLLQQVAQSYGLVSVTEVLDPRQVKLVCEYTDILQIGTRNMYNTPLLNEVGKINKPVILKRGMSATIEEFLLAAEYIILAGNNQIILCERGIRTFERQTRNTLDISAIPLLKQKTDLPVIADISHAAGRKDILAALGKAALAAGADGIMVEVHPSPSVARSDSQQQLDLAEFSDFLESLNYNSPQ